jgi:hypothetical protein
MNLYLLTQDKARGYDTCSSIIVTAETEEEARAIHPCMAKELSAFWIRWDYDDDNKEENMWRSRIWAKSPVDVEVQLLGTACPDIKGDSIIQYCFHAG